MMNFMLPNMLPKILPKILPKLFPVAAVLIAESPTAYAQEMSTDRPDQTESSWVIPKGMVQIETGVSAGNDAFGDSPSAGITSLTLRNIGIGSTLVRVGLLERLELRLETGYVMEKSEGKQRVGQTEEPFSESLKGLDALAVGVKIGIAEEAGALPETSLIFHATLPAGSEAFQPSHVIPDFRFTLSHSLSQTVSLGYNLGAEWNDAGTPPDGIYTLVVGSDLAESVGGFLELFGTLSPHGAPQHTLDGGLTWGLHENLQLDAAAGVGLTEAAEDFFVGAGVSFRVMAW
jgi:hypothetical protein